MSKIKYNISLDMHSSVSQASLAAKQGDDNRQFAITLRSGGQPYKIERGAFAVFSTTLPDGKVIEDNCIIADNEIIYDFTQNLTSQVGVLDIEIRLYDHNSRLVTSPSFILVVSTRAAAGETITSSDSYTALDALYKDARELNDTLEKKLANGDFDGEDVNYNLVSNALKGSASGNPIILDDVSPIEHILKVKATGDNVSDLSSVVLKRCGKNFYDYKKAINYTSYGVAFTNNNNGTMTLSGVPTQPTSFALANKNNPILLPLGKCYFKALTFEGSKKSVYAYVTVYNKSGESVGDYFDLGSGVGFEVFGDGFTATAHVVVQSEYKGELKILKPQIELNITATDFEPFTEHKTYRINADGTVNDVTSIYPTTTLMVDTEGVTLDVEYNRDINILTKTVPLIDRVTGIPYYLYVSGGKLLIEEREV